MSRAGAGGWLFLLFFAANYQRGSVVRRRNPRYRACKDRHFFAVIRCFAACYQHFL
jgi:hypothetical protein